MGETLGFAKLLRGRMLAQANLLEALTGHPSLVGAGREQALSELLRELVPRRYEVLSGTVLGCDTEGHPRKESRQIDVMIVDTLDYPTVLRSGDIAVALPQAVRAIVEVKSNLAGGETFLNAVEQIATLQTLLGEGETAFSALMSYGAPQRGTTLHKWLTDLLAVREERRDALARKKAHPGTSDRTVEELEDGLSLLSAANLPSLVVADDGAIAIKSNAAPAGGGGTAPAYRFMRPVSDTPAIFALVEQIVRYLGTATATPETRDRLDKGFDLLSAALETELEPEPRCADISIVDPPRSMPGGEPC